MGFWSFYFFAKLIMFAAGFIGFHVLENLCFALFVALPFTARWLRVCKQIIALPVGVALLYHDSWLPPWQRIFAQQDDLSGFSVPYLIELSGRFINPQLVLALGMALLLYWLLSRKLRMSSFAFLSILIAPWIGVWSGVVVPTAPLPDLRTDASGDGLSASGDVFSSTPAALTARLEAFYQLEQQRRVRFPPIPEETQPFDVLLLQVCSLSWDDLNLVGLRDHPFLSRFDIRFDRFNAAASYSGPAAIRLLRANCGQASHEGLYRPVDDACKIVLQFEEAGFAPNWVMNHDGVFADMLGDIRVRGGMPAALASQDGLQPVLKAFDGTDYYGDYATLSRWWTQRLESDAERVLLYYNTGTLHDGNRFVGGGRLGTQESYRRRAQMLFDDLNRFLDDLERSGRRAVVVMVPEHGANMRGDRMQISGLREIPSPAIAMIPVGVTLVGREERPLSQEVTTPTSYLALSTLLGRFLGSSPFAQGSTNLDDYVRDLPETPFVAENEGVIIMHAADRYWMRTADGRWSEYLASR